MRDFLNYLHDILGLISHYKWCSQCHHTLLWRYKQRRVMFVLAGVGEYRTHPVCDTCWSTHGELIHKENMVVQAEVFRKNSPSRSSHHEHFTTVASPYLNVTTMTAEQSSWTSRTFDLDR